MIYIVRHGQTAGNKAKVLQGRGSNGSYWSKYIGNCAVYVFRIIDGEYTVPAEIRIGQHPAKQAKDVRDK